MLAEAQQLLYGSIVSTLDEIATALKLVAERNRVIAEGAAACAVAAAMRTKGKVIAIISGGNIDLNKFCELVTPRISPNPRPHGTGL
jgi:threonine dehydratase